MSTKEEGRAWFTLLIGLPALIGWIAYGMAWVLEPRFPGLITPIQAAGGAAGIYYSILLIVGMGASGTYY